MQLHSPESISKDLMNGAVRLADNRGLLGPGGEELRAARQAFAAELADVVRAVGDLRTSRSGSLDPPRPHRRPGTLTAVADIDDLLDEVERGPQGPHVGRLLRLRRHAHRRLLGRRSTSGSG